jgi:hypothetical protein
VGTEQGKLQWVQNRVNCSGYRTGYIAVGTEQGKLQWVQDPNQSNVDNLNNVRRPASRHFRNKKQEYLKAKIAELETNSKTKILDTSVGA